MGKSTHTWFLAAVSVSLSVSLFCLSRFQSGSLFLVLVFEDSLPLIIHHLSGLYQGLRIFWPAGRFFDLPHAHATDDTKWEVQGWKISNSIATHPPSRWKNRTPSLSSRVYAFPSTTYWLSRSPVISVSVLNRGLCNCRSLCMCVCVEYLLHQQYSRFDAGEFDWLIFFFSFWRRVTSRCVWYIFCPLLNCNGFLSF